jgi:hypothetical protein
MNAVAIQVAERGRKGKPPAEIDAELQEVIALARARVDYA